MTENGWESHRPSINGTQQSSLRGVCAELHKQVEAFLQEDVETAILQSVQKRCRHSLSIISEAVNRYPFPALSLSYNGGKDCLVLLILYLSLLADHPDLPSALPAIYIPTSSPFPAQEVFVEESSARYHLALSRHSHPSMRLAFSSYLSSADGGPVGAIFVGTRRTDPHGAKLTPFDMTDHGWPSFMRVHPVLEWHYAEVWAFLKKLGVQYCPLYDEGFTSLGGKEDTRPNPMLAIKDETGEVVEFKPAYELVEDQEERLGRV